MGIEGPAESGVGQIDVAITYGVTVPRFLGFMVFFDADLTTDLTTGTFSLPPHVSDPDMHAY